jgi:4-diphosphocytidyl-2-C-methyl-D-erythritol kinase
VGLYDRLRFTVPEKPGVRICCDDAALATEDNLACRAAAALARRIGRAPALEIEIEKQVPVGGGMGGGSSDAAVTLQACNGLWEADLSDTELAEIGANLGSDVSLFFSLPSAVISGRGEHVQPVKLRWSGWALLVMAPAPVSTAETYGEWRASDGSPSGPEVVEVIMSASSSVELNDLLFNDLQPAIFRLCPKVARVYDALRRAGVGGLRVTGAGSTLFGLFDHREEAVRVADRIESLNLGVNTVVAAAPVGPGNVFLGEDV